MPIRVVQERRARYSEPATACCEECGSDLSAYIHDLVEKESSDFSRRNVHYALILTSNCPICETKITFTFRKKIEAVNHQVVYPGEHGGQ